MFPFCKSLKEAIDFVTPLAEKFDFNPGELFEIIRRTEG